MEPLHQVSPECLEDPIQGDFRYWQSVIGSRLNPVLCATGSGRYEMTEASLELDYLPIPWADGIGSGLATIVFVAGSAVPNNMAMTVILGIHATIHAVRFMRAIMNITPRHVRLWWEMIRWIEVCVGPKAGQIAIHLRGESRNVPVTFTPLEGTAAFLESLPRRVRNLQSLLGNG